jgi:serine/threonine protein kinase
VKSIYFSELISNREIENEIENLMNLSHPLIATPFGFVLPMESMQSQELKIAWVYAEGSSLSTILSAPALWWAPTAKAQTIVSIALALRFAHSFGLLHGALTASNILFDKNHCIQIADFTPLRLETREVGGFSGARWTQRTDI